MSKGRQELLFRGAYIALLGVTLATPPSIACAGVFSFTRKDYELQSNSTGLDSVAVGDVDGRNGPDIVVESLTGGTSLGRVTVLLSNGNGSFAAARGFDSCSGAHSIVLAQLNPSTDDNLDVAVVCGNTLIGRKLGDGHGNFGGTRPVDVGATAAAAGTGNPYVSIIDLLRTGAINGPTLVFAGWLEESTEFTLCFIENTSLERDLDGGGPKKRPTCHIITNEEGEVTEFGPVARDLAVGEYSVTPGDTKARDEAIAFASTNSAKPPVAITTYTPFEESAWDYQTRNGGNVRAAVALTDVDDDLQNDILLGGKGVIAEYVPGYPIDLQATPTKSFASVPSLYDLVTADFDGDGHIDIAALGDDDTSDEDVTVGIHRGDGHGSFAAYEGFKTKGYAFAEGRQVIAVADFDSNHTPDIVTVGSADPFASVLLNDVKFPVRTCGDAVTIVGQTDTINATDALAVLNSATGLRACLRCVCDVNDSGSTTATDALSVLRFAVGDDLDLTCPAC